MNSSVAPSTLSTAMTQVAELLVSSNSPMVQMLAMNTPSVTYSTIMARWSWWARRAAKASCRRRWVRSASGGVPGGGGGFWRSRPATSRCRSRLRLRRCEVVRMSEPQADTSTAGVNMAERMVRVPVSADMGVGVSGIKKSTSC